MATGAMLSELHPNQDFLLLSRSVAEFGERELVPRLRQLGREEFPAWFIPLTGKRGFLGTAVPAEYGGHGGTLENFLSVMDGIAACNGSMALTLAAHESLATTHILLGGTDEQKRRFLPDLAAGRKLAAWCLTESQAGSNIFNDTRTRLQRSGEGWELSGEKTLITNGCHADLFVVLARAVGPDGQDRGITACIVERKDHEALITTTPLHDKMGMWRSDTATVKFDVLPVPDRAILGPTGSGGNVARQVLLRGRIGIAALALGLARDSLERAVAYAKGRKVAGGTLFVQPLTRAKFDRMEESLWAAWQGVRNAAERVDASKPVKVQACIAKVFATEAALRIIDESIQILGGYGYFRDYKVEQNYRDARLLTIGEGATEILKFAIARNLSSDPYADPDVLPSPESLAAAGLKSGSISDIWGSSGRALELAAECVHLVREQIERSRAMDSAATWQPRAAGFAKLAIRFWIATQAMINGTKLAEGGNASPRQVNLIKSFLVNSSIEICHYASEFLRTQGLTDARLFGNYMEALQIGT